jgi:hypothetical protein
MHSQVRAVEPPAADGGGGADERAGWRLEAAASLVAAAHYGPASPLSILSAAGCVPYIYPSSSATQEGLIGRGYAGPAVALDGETLSEAQVILTRHASQGR